MARNTIETEIDLDAYGELLRVAETTHAYIHRFDGRGSVPVAMSDQLFREMREASDRWQERAKAPTVIEDSTANGFDPTAYGDQPRSAQGVADYLSAAAGNEEALDRLKERLK